MLASDSETSDYEDAQEHHDNYEDYDHVPFPINLAEVAVPNPEDNGQQNSPDVPANVDAVPAGNDNVPIVNANEAVGVDVEAPNQNPEHPDEGEESPRQPQGRPLGLELRRLEREGGQARRIRLIREILPADPEEDDYEGLGHNVRERQRRSRMLRNQIRREMRAAMERDLDLEPDMLAMDSDSEDEDDDSVYSDERAGDDRRSRSVDSPSVGDQERELSDFDQQLPIRHAYLGNDMELLPRNLTVYLDDGYTAEIPLIIMGIQLVPNQTLPLTVFHAAFQNAIRRCIANDRIFGIVHNDTETVIGSTLYKGALGTLAEIYEFQEERSPGLGLEDRDANTVTFSLKAKGRQRFNVIDFRRQADGNLIGRVKIRPEIRLPSLFESFDPNDRFRFPLKRKHQEGDREADDESIPTSSTKLSRQASTSSARCTVYKVANEVTSGVEPYMVAMKDEINERRKGLRYYSAMTPFPYFVYEHFDEKVLVEKVHRKLKVELHGLTESECIIPTDATELSFWLAQNLTMDDYHRINILKMDNPVQRLRYELDLLTKACKVITCRYCQTTIAESKDIFSMSIEGPQGTYVNPHGFVHETLTVHKTREVRTRGQPSTEASWFPGYSWTIVECRGCASHVGWKFRAVDKLTPKKFWGLCRKSISYKYDLNYNSERDELIDLQTRSSRLLLQQPTLSSEGDT